MKVFKGKIWAAIGSLMDHAGTAASTKASAAAAPDRALLADIDAAVERCTAGGGGADDDRHVHEILFLVSNAPGAITFLSRRITARLESARAPAAALRSLLLVHRLLRAGDRYFEQDLRGVWASRDLRVAAPAPRCCSCSPHAAAAAAASYVVSAAAGACAFVHGYSAYLEERMQWVITQAGNLEPARRHPPPPPPPPDADCDGDGKPPPPHDDADAEALLFKLGMCQRLLDLAIQLLPDNNTSGCAAARSAFGIVLRESFKVYDAFAEGLDAMLQRLRRSHSRSRSRSLAGLSKPLRVSAHEILKKACAQTPDLKEFYHKCKGSSASIKSLEYPLVRVVTPAQATAAEIEEEPPMAIPKEEDGREEAEAGDGGGSPPAPFARRMETTISTVWVEFEEDERLISGGDGDGDDDHALKAVRPS